MVEDTHLFFWSRSSRVCRHSQRASIRPNLPQTYELAARFKRVEPSRDITSEVNGSLSDSCFQTSLTSLGRPLCWDSLQVSRSRLAFSLWQLHFELFGLLRDNNLAGGLRRRFSNITFLPAVVFGRKSGAPPKEPARGSGALKSDAQTDFGH